MQDSTSKYIHSVDLWTRKCLLGKYGEQGTYYKTEFYVLIGLHVSLLQSNGTGKINTAVAPQISVSVAGYVQLFLNWSYFPASSVYSYLYK